jgi:hypothetical protein
MPKCVPYCMVRNIHKTGTASSRHALHMPQMHLGCDACTCTHKHPTLAQGIDALSNKPFAIPCTNTYTHCIKQSIVFNRFQPFLVKSNCIKQSITFKQLSQTFRGMNFLLDMECNAKSFSKQYVCTVLHVCAVRSASQDALDWMLNNNCSSCSACSMQQLYNTVQHCLHG